VRTRTAVDLTPLLTAAAVFWFEAWGLMGLGTAWLLFSFSCAFGGCSPGGSPAMTWIGVGLAALVVVGGGSRAWWIATRDRPRARATGFLGLGIVALAAIALVAAIAPLAAIPVAFWTGWPGIVLVVASGRQLLAMWREATGPE
jgi:hypothetical protein